ncbi:hypothetical protein CYLTODRAFT_398199 [Cylindrobasidium torrendii FP15055 ss-10]|uniref:TPR-like protein n=1 Tax=Cylindrobasidium torrendii FP15055 ss-10 TaxID=1314674 RepID=A0A0D7B9E5_9AGAR|nr:hypothetical protein CYLTODRAFT_398199 [Cylindrobasidium torrendii FP15055 ss-10]
MSLDTPPPVHMPYAPKNALDDIPAARYALHSFYASKMVEAEAYIDENDPEKKRLYFASCNGLFQCIKSLMSFEDEDILQALQKAKQGNGIASEHRRKTSSFTSKLAGYVSGSNSAIENMTPLERHAELIYAETLIEKAMLSVAYSGDWLSLLKEVLNMRTTFNIYQALYKYITTTDASAANGHDLSIDEDLRSGVYFGYGLSSLILSLLPSKVITIVHIFGYTGNRKEALDVLSRAGGWSDDNAEPSKSSSQGGLRRLLCDMLLVTFHLVMSLITFDGINIDTAEKILRWHFAQYPDSVFGLWANGRLRVARGKPAEAVEFYIKSIESQSQYPQLHAMSYWELAVVYISLWDVPSSLSYWRKLESESTWSRATYMYGIAACLLQGNASGHEEAKELFKQVPGMLQKIAGKSIPMEKFVSRRARKFMDQGCRLVLPALELGYLLSAFAHTPPEVISKHFLPEIRRNLVELEAHKGRKGFYDDLCLCRFLEGVCLRYLAHPDADSSPFLTAPTIEELEGMLADETSKKAALAFKDVFRDGPKIQWDHHIVYQAHYEYGRLLSREGKLDEAKEQFQLILSGKHLEVGPSGKKGKYSLKDALHLQAHAASEALGKRPL